MQNISSTPWVYLNWALAYFAISIFYKTAPIFEMTKSENRTFGEEKIQVGGKCTM